MKKKESNTITEIPAEETGDDSEFKSPEASMVDLVAHMKPGEIFGWPIICFPLGIASITCFLFIQPT